MPVRREKYQELTQRMASLGVSESDFREHFTRSSGPGGQKTNKTSTCVHLVHVPTGLSVKCQEERSQALNRFLARRILLDRIESLQRESSVKRDGSGKESAGRNGDVPGAPKRKCFMTNTAGRR
jgi:protein subunit release factor B